MGLFRSSEFASGTRVLFQQSTAPVGWTKDATHNDKSLRVVNGSVSSGGSVAFSAFTGQSVGATTLSTEQIPQHAHGIRGGGDQTGEGLTLFQNTIGNTTGSTNNQGGGGSHTHSLNMALQYVDAIICAKN